MTKQELRKNVHEKRKLMTEEKVAASSSEIIDRLIRTIEFDDFDEFFFYHPLAGEVSLLPLAAQVISIGKRIYFPRVSGESMEFYRVTGLNKDFAEGNFHVMEPIGGETPSFERTLMFVPGLAFDASMHRLGHGKGYYDKYLEQHPGIKTVGICANAFFMPEIPAEPHDMKMDQIVTETTVYGVR
jgi:5-formyltetrahydrofolate cyclo-ligase